MNVRRTALHALRASVVAAGIIGSVSACDAGELFPPLSPPSLPSSTREVEPEPEPLEDSPLFDCRLHGNRICGPGALLPNGEPASLHPLPPYEIPRCRVAGSVLTPTFVCEDSVK